MRDYENTFNYRTGSLIKFLSINYILSIFIEFQYILIIPKIDNIWSILFVYSALFSNTLIIYLAISLVLLPFMIFKAKRVFYLLIVPLVIIVQLLAVTDVVIYNIFKFHINAVIINFFTTEGSWESIYLGTGTTTSIGLIILAIIFSEFLLMRKLLKKPSKKKYVRRKSGIVKYIIIIMLVFVALDKISYAVADLYNNTQITRFLKLYPLYQPLTVKRTMDRVFGFKVDRENNLKIDRSSSILKYPTVQLDIPDNVTKPNIVWIVLDAYRSDMLNKDITPNIFEFSKEAQVFENHMSGGIATRFGIFSMFYGVFTYNWHQFLGERISPVFMDKLIDLGYDFSISSSTRLTYPEFRKTAFLRIPEKVHDTFEGNNSHEKDRSQIDFFLHWMDNYKLDKPFFSFVFLDSSHSRVYPPEYEKFKTDSKTTNYLFVTNKSSSNAKLNYANSLWYEDHLVKEILDALKNKGVMDNTIILITGDHGEEFHEHGFFGHNSAFTPEQVHVPMVLYIPKMAPKKYQKLTSHLDLVPTIFDTMGIHSDSSTYSNGFSMFGDMKRDYTVTCSWNNCGYLNDDNTIVFSMETYNSGLFEVRDKDYKEVEDPKVVLKKNMKNLLQIMKDFSRFNK